MTFQQTDERVRARRQRAERAIKLAMESKWAEAAQENEAIIAMFPKDVDAHNRLGKALTELGRYAEGRAAYQRALELDPNNAIARKNLDRLQALGEAAPAADGGRQKVDPDLFIEEIGKTGVAALQRPNRDVLQRLTAGDRVTLRRQGNALIVELPTGEYVGMVEARLALRLTRLMETGNEYAAAIAAVSPAGDQGRVIIKETRQSPQNVGRLSFPATGPEGPRAYTKESLLRYDLEEEETEAEEAEESEEWEGETEVESGPEISFDYEKAREIEADREEFEE
jgi:tetratricopeptide (TPR) repeat protein